MAPNYWHLLWNHTPLFSLAFGFVILFISFINKNNSTRTLGLVILVLGALLTIPAVLTGDEAEHFVEEIDGISQFYLHEHEELGEVALTVNLVAGSFALIALFAPTFFNQYKKFIDIITLIASVFGIFITIVAAKHGGQIRRPELWNKQEIQEHSHSEIEAPE